MEPSKKIPRVSIGLPVYNGAKYLEEAIDSILGQTCQDFELIITDNASTDRTEEICRRYQSQDGRVRYLRSEKNHGAAWNYNRAFELARGEYFRWASHDDCLAPENLARCVEVLDREPSVVLCYPKTINIDESGNEIELFEDRVHLVWDQPHKRLGRLVTKYRMCNAVFGLIRSEVLRETSLIGKYSGSDFILLIQLCLRGKYWEVPEPLFFRRLHPAMSRRANVHFRDVEKWFDTSHRRGGRFRRWRLFREQIKSIRQAPLTRSEKYLCYLQVAKWVIRRIRVEGGKHKALLKQRLRSKHMSNRS